MIRAFGGKMHYIMYYTVVLLAKYLTTRRLHVVEYLAGRCMLKKIHYEMIRLFLDIGLLRSRCGKEVRYPHFL